MNALVPIGTAAPAAAPLVALLNVNSEAMNPTTAVTMTGVVRSLSTELSCIRSHIRDAVDSLDADRSSHVASMKNIQEQLRNASKRLDSLLGATQDGLSLRPASLRGEALPGEPPPLARATSSPIEMGVGLPQNSLAHMNRPMCRTPPLPCPDDALSLDDYFSRLLVTVMCPIRPSANSPRVVNPLLIYTDNTSGTPLEFVVTRLDKRLLSKDMTLRVVLLKNGALPADPDYELFRKHAHGVAPEADCPAEEAEDGRVLEDSKAGR